MFHPFLLSYEIQASQEKMVRDTTEHQGRMVSQVTMASLGFQENQDPKDQQDPKETQATMASRDRREMQDTQASQVFQVHQERMVHQDPREIVATTASLVNQVHQDLREIKARPERRETQATQASQATQARMARMVRMVRMVPQVHQVHQVIQEHQESLASITTHQPQRQLQLNLRPQRHLLPTPLEAAGANTDSASTGRPTAAATVPTKRTTNQWTLWKSNETVVNQQDLNILSTTNIFIMYTHMYNVH